MPPNNCQLSVGQTAAPLATSRSTRSNAATSETSHLASETTNMLTATGVPPASTAPATTGEQPPATTSWMTVTPATTRKQPPATAYLRYECYTCYYATTGPPNPNTCLPAI